MSTFYKRSRFLFIIFILLFVAILIKLLYIQIWQYESLNDKALQTWNRQLPERVERGLILDRNGEVLVTNQLQPAVYVMPGQVTDQARLISELTKWSGLPQEVVTKEVTRKGYLNHLRQTSKAISKEKLSELQNAGIEGLYTTLAFERHYPYTTMLAPVLGFTGADGYGLAGLEYKYDAVLSGEDGSLEIFTDAKGKRTTKYADRWNSGQPGYHLELTIDRTIQQLLETKLTQAIDQYDAKQALGIVMDPQTGELLAMASLPTFDPKQYNEQSTDLIYKNLPVTMTFEPGSTFKIITLSAAIEEKLVNLETDHFHDPGYSMIAGHRIRCWKRQGHGAQSFMEVVENSCNPGFIELGQRLGEDKLRNYISQFGFGESTGSGLAGEQKGILFSEENYGPLEHATTSFGQGISVTPMQQITAVAAAINGGYLLQPNLVSKTIDPLTKNPVAESTPVVKRRVISEETSKTVREALGEVVAHGSGQHAYRSYVSIGGKTGTAQKVSNGRYMEGEYIVSFIGFAPVQEPKYLIYVAIDAPKGPSQFGGTMAAPIVGEMFEDIAEESEQVHVKKQAWNDLPEKEVPSLVGLSKQELITQLDDFTLVWHGSGTKIVEQLPQAGERSPAPYYIHVYTD